MTPAEEVGPTWSRYVALGDSSTEGLEDPDGHGGYRGWANRLAERIAAVQGSLAYANLGVRGRRTRQILETQLEPALAMEPDLVTLFAGTNDVVGKGFDPDTVGTDLEALFGAFTRTGATVLTFTLPDLTDVLPPPLGQRLAPRIEVLARVTRHAAAASGAIVVDFGEHAISTDLRYWNPDRFHANATGHAMIAEALAHAAGVPGAEDVLHRPTAPGARRGVMARTGSDLWWFGRYLVPHLWRHMRGRSSGDGRAPKYPRLVQLTGSMEFQRSRTAVRASETSVQ